jgi:putative spermidine/putrescine transport system substrate-binding protein
VKPRRSPAASGGRRSVSKASPSRRATALVLAGLFVGAACSDDGGDVEPLQPVQVLDDIGDGEGNLSLLALAGYVEDGSSDPEFDWVTPFQEATGCDVEVRYVDSGQEIVTLLERDDAPYDGASVPGDAAGELISSRIVAAVDPALFPSWDQVLPPLREENARHYVVDGTVYGVPALYGPNLLVFDRERVDPEPRSWGVVYEPDTPYAGRIAMLDSPMTIADAALYLAAHRPDLGIEDPFALSPAQLDAAVALLRDQQPRVRLYWSLFTDAVDAFRERDVLVGTGWPIVLSLLELGQRSVGAVVPAEGITGWADTWMIAAEAPHPNCMLMWMRWSLEPRVQAETALWYGGAPSNGRACGFIRSRLRDFADLADTLRFGRCGDEQFLASLALWRMPTVECGDDRGRSCTGLPAWRTRWRFVLG